VTWLRSFAGRWKPAGPDEGREIRESLESLIAAIAAAPSHALATLMDDAAEDLDAKTEHCREHGLASLQHVRVTTKREGIEEVKGLEVLYMEKFLEIVPNSKPKIFVGFSSPAAQEIVPGRYLFWARNPLDHSKAGPRKEARVGSGQPGNPIEVLAP
jgi:hypothetical protein